MSHHIYVGSLPNLKKHHIIKQGSPDQIQTVVLFIFYILPSVYNLAVI